ncbi:hypothetical protein FIBSPDRAFT_817674 [Athelia psychrophila]|uniref:ABC1 atypical kinase-like domain-containing protein n=1 Tax=Athelia psychrophila TaxID=1759441 RepID=A0A166RAW6_9AGAM|nr:hypothetical protein FIBSPDRAFT_817674 [Fibularhizoctonia sp. CBS 109695]
MVSECYQSGASLRLHLAGSPTTVELEVVQAFTPFTWSQVLLVKLSIQSPTALPSPFILKTFDPRFIGERLKTSPWSSSGEAKAVRSRILEVDPNFRGSREPGYDDDSDDEDFVKPPMEKVLEEWEEYWWQYSAKQHQNESSAYAALPFLQGNGIPRCYGSGTMDLPGRAICPRALLLEYIQGSKTLRDVHPSAVGDALVKSLITTVELMQERVMHDDMNPGNILFSPGDRPTRAVLIDFGNAVMRRDGRSDENWHDSNDDLHAMKICLRVYLKINLT